MVSACLWGGFMALCFFLPYRTQFAMARGWARRSLWMLDRLCGLKFTVEGRWYESPNPNDFFAGGKDKPECDYLISHHGGRWEIENACSRSNWAIANINIQTRQIGFRMSGHDPGYPSVELYVTFTLSDDGQRLEGMESVYSKMNEFQGARAVRWIRRP